MSLKGEIWTKRPGGNCLDFAYKFYWMVKLVCILGLGWISCNMGVVGAMFWTLVSKQIWVRKAKG